MCCSQNEVVSTHGPRGTFQAQAHCTLQYRQCFEPARRHHTRRLRCDLHHTRFWMHAGTTDGLATTKERYPRPHVWHTRTCRAQARCANTRTAPPGTNTNLCRLIHSFVKYARMSTLSGTLCPKGQANTRTHAHAHNACTQARIRTFMQSVVRLHSLTRSCTCANALWQLLQCKHTLVASSRKMCLPKNDVAPF